MKHAAAVRMVARGCHAPGADFSRATIPEELLKLEIEGGTMINSGPERTPPSARPSRDGCVPQPARTNCLFTFLILMYL